MERYGMNKQAAKDIKEDGLIWQKVMEDYKW